MGEEEYETLAPNYPLWVHMSAGALAGMTEHVVMYPVDSVKTRLQSLCPCPEIKCQTPIHGVASMIRREGWLKPLRGVVKQRMQMKFSPYGGSLECARCVYRTEGLTAFYRSYTTQLMMNVPFQAVHFVTYEFFQEARPSLSFLFYSRVQILNPRHQYDPKTHLIAGGIAGGLAAAITTPLDCVKTVLNTQQTPEIDGQNRILLKATKHYRGIVDAVQSIHQERGLAGFTRGLQARVVYQVPATALSWSVYELFKFILTDAKTMA
ncbi:hypothetical protein M3Y99_00566600 [Aphelenchoides fujianensis]|nr:hypothetical protein M3Y99_00566600 [Aphelenchoides fujianensis]